MSTLFHQNVSTIADQGIDLANFDYLDGLFGVEHDDYTFEGCQSQKSRKPADAICTAAEPTTKTKETVPCRIPSTNTSASTPYVNIDSSSDVTKTQMAHTINRNRSGLSQTRRVLELTAAASVIFPSGIMCALEYPFWTTARQLEPK